MITKPSECARVQALISNPYALLRVWDLVLYVIKSIFTGSKRAQRRLWARQYGSYGGDVPNHTLTVVLLFTFSVMQVRRLHQLHHRIGRLASTAVHPQRFPPAYSGLLHPLHAALHRSGRGHLLRNCWLRRALPAALRLPRGVPERRPLLAHRALRGKGSVETRADRSKSLGAAADATRARRSSSR